MFYLTPQERKFLVLVIMMSMAGAAIQLSFKRDIAPMRWARHVRRFKVHINTAREDQFQMLPGIGSKLAGRIVKKREESGPFKSIDDLRQVRGLTAKRFGQIRGLIEL